LSRLALKVALGAIFIAPIVPACTWLQTPLQQYRPADQSCENHSLDETAECQRHALQEFEDSGDPNIRYTLGFVEFDDQGLVIDRDQMNSVLKYVADLDEDKDLLVVVFMHGWHHSAAPGDSNIRDFRRVLEGLRRSEILATACTKELSGFSKEINGTECTSKGAPDRIAPREVVGVYLGWRGDSLKSPLLNWSTFWERKNTAQTVGHVGVTEVLTKLEKLKGPQASDNRNKLIVIGHSFGGAAVFAALTQILESRFVRTADLPELGEPALQDSQAVEGFGDLVVLVNPAFEALLFKPLRDMSTEYGQDHGYPEKQLPVLGVLTSEEDTATKNWFRRGRWFSTLFDREEVKVPSNDIAVNSEDKKLANITALGHFEPYETHFLGLKPQAEIAATQKAIVPEEFFQAADCWRHDGPNSKIEFDSTILERTGNSVGRNPYLIVQVDDRVIDIDKQEDQQENEQNDSHHNDVWDADLIDVVKQLILISSQTPRQTAIIANPSIAPCRVSAHSERGP
jgi:hypothetical protein